LEPLHFNHDIITVTIFLTSFFSNFVISLYPKFCSVCIAPVFLNNLSEKELELLGYASIFSTRDPTITPRGRRQIPTRVCPP